MEIGGVTFIGVTSCLLCSPLERCWASARGGDGMGPALGQRAHVDLGNRGGPSSLHCSGIWEECAS